MTKRTWHRGPPPEIGWWPASRERRVYDIRWWDGEHWSFSAMTTHTAKDAARLAKMVAFDGPGMEIKWCERWWL